MIRKTHILETSFVASVALTCCFLLSMFPGASADVCCLSKDEMQCCHAYACFMEEKEWIF